ncbi:MAG: protocatechuate 3,4-dioxygenase [Reyranellaceae bacterium]
MPSPLGRRSLIAGAGATLIGAPAILRADARALTPTPAQTEGPFYPVTLPLDRDNDLIAVSGAEARARGTVLHLSGQVLDRSSRPIANARVEIWQCDWQGIYLHPRDRGQNRRDAGFQGFGMATTDSQGRYRFRTIRPVAYAGRTPHIHFKVAAGNSELTTQMYVAGEAGNGRDFLYRNLGEAASLVTVALEPAAQLEAGAVSGRFDIVVV